MQSPANILFYSRYNEHLGSIFAQHNMKAIFRGLVLIYWNVFKEGELLTLAPLIDAQLVEWKGNPVVTTIANMDNVDNTKGQEDSMKTESKVFSSPVIETVNTRSQSKMTRLDGKLSRLSLKNNVSLHLSGYIQVERKETAQISRRMLKKPSTVVSHRKGKVTGRSNVLEQQGENKKLEEICNRSKSTEEDGELIRSKTEYFTDHEQNSEANVDACRKTKETNSKTMSLSQRLDCTLNVCDSPKTIPDSDQKPLAAQTSGAKSRIPVGLIRREKSKLKDKAIVRRKSFLRKGDGMVFRKKFSKQLATKSLPSSVKDGVATINSKSPNKTTPALLSLAKKKDAANSTFVLRDVPEKTRYQRALSKSKKISSRTALAKSDDTSVAVKRKSIVSPQARKQWSESGVKTYEGMIISSIFAFSKELKESTESITEKLQSLYDSVDKTKANLARKSNIFSREWRQNNEDILNSGGQEIAGIFRNLRKVETNLKTIDQAVALLMKVKSKENLKGLKDFEIMQKGLK